MTADIAIVIPCHRAEGTLARAVESALAQEGATVEVVLAPDDGVDYLARLAAAGLRDDRLAQAPPGPLRSGPSAARNRALALAGAPFVAPLDADDALAPGYVTALLAPARLEGAAAARLEATLGDGRAVRSPIASAPGGELDWRDIVGANFPIFFMARRDLLGGGWAEDLRFAEDMVMNLELRARVARYVVATGACYRYAIGTNSLTTGADTGLQADRHYRDIIERVGSGRTAVPEAARAEVVGLIKRKRERNAAFERARGAGFEGCFYDFAAAPGGGSA